MYECIFVIIINNKKQRLKYYNTKKCYNNFNTKIKSFKCLSVEL